MFQATRQFLEEINKWTSQHGVSPLSRELAVKFLMARKFDVLRAIELFHSYRVRASGDDDDAAAALWDKYKYSRSTAQRPKTAVFHPCGVSWLFFFFFFSPKLPQHEGKSAMRANITMITQMWKYAYDL